MDLKRLRTFVVVAELGTVSRAAVRLRISQSALSRQISDLEQEFGFELFDRIGRRLMLTAVGEQLLGDCRGLLGQVGSLGERIELLRRGDRGVLKVAAPPQTIESVLSTFLPRYVERFPEVQVKLTEALGPEQSAMLELGEVHIGIRHDQYANRYLASHALPPDEVLAGAARPFSLATPARSISAASHPVRCCCWNPVTRFAECSMQRVVSQVLRLIFWSRAARRTRCSHSPRPGTGWRSFHRYCERIATR